mgnify:CR=1 FL=1
MTEMSVAAKTHCVQIAASEVAVSDDEPFDLTAEQLQSLEARSQQQSLEAQGQQQSFEDQSQQQWDGVAFGSDPTDFHNHNDFHDESAFHLQRFSSDYKQEVADHQVALGSQYDFLLEAAVSMDQQDCPTLVRLLVACSSHCWSGAGSS